MLKALRAKMNGYSIKNSKKMNGHDGLIWSATILKGKDKIVEAVDDGNGGGVHMSYHFNKTLQDQFVADAKKHDPKAQFEVDGTYAAFLTETHENIKRIERMCKTKTLVVMTTDKPDKCSMYKVPYTPQFGQRLRQLHGAKILTIVNEEV